MWGGCFLGVVSSDPYYLIYQENETEEGEEELLYRSEYIMNDSNPHWRRGRFNIITWNPNSDADVGNISFRIDVFDADRVTDEIIGSTYVTLAEITQSIEGSLQTSNLPEISTLLRPFERRSEIKPPKPPPHSHDPCSTCSDKFLFFLALQTTINDCSNSKSICSSLLHLL